MKLKILDLDYKGVLPLNGENVQKFYDRGSQFLDAAQELKSKLGSKKELIDITSELGWLKNKFMTVPDWISCYFRKINKARATPEGDILIVTGTTKGTSCNNVRIPAIGIDSIFEHIDDALNRIKRTKIEAKSGELSGELAKLYVEAIEELDENLYITKRHEMIHCIRYSLKEPSCLLDLIFNFNTVAIREAIVQFLVDKQEYLFSEIKSHEKARPMYALLKEIDEKIEKAGYAGLSQKLNYVLLRLKPKEIKNLVGHFRNSEYSEEALKKYLEKAMKNKNLRLEIILHKI